MKKLLGYVQKILNKKELIHILLDAFEAEDIAEGKIIIKSYLLNGRLKDTIIPKVEQLEDYNITFSEDQIELTVKVKYGLWLVSILYTVRIVDINFNSDNHRIDLNYTEEVIDMVGIGGGFLPKLGKLVKKISNKNYIQFVKLTQGIIITGERIIVDFDYVDAIKEILSEQPSINEIYQQVEIKSVELLKDEIVLTINVD